ncbi:MAG: carbohydrate ABC transporter substrate-binding protein [Oscillospiraceae bacterium]|nr:carbohydrate ABC transporter substrate-binding protein [Oscillospiraceae bacterium]
MKKLIAMLLALVMVLSMAACGASEPAPTEADKADTPVNTPVENNGSAEESKDEGGLNVDWIFEEDPASVKGTVNFYIPFKGSQGMDAMIAEFNETYPNVEVVLNTYNNNSDGNAAVNTAILAGEVDVLASFGLSNTYKRWEAAMFYDLTDMCEEYGIDLVEHWGTDAFTYEDCIYTFPCGGLSYYVCINMDAWNEAGLGELPTEWTWAEYIEVSEKLTEYNADGSVAVYGGSDYHSVNYFTYCSAQIDGLDPYYEADGTSSFDSEVYLKALQREYDAEVVNKIWYPKATYRGDNLQTQQIFLQDQLANTAINPNMVRYMTDRENYGTDWKVGFAPWPVEEAGQTNNMSGVATFSHAGICIEDDDEDFEAAWAWLRWYSTHGVKYLVAAGHQPKWIGTETGAALNLLFGSEEEAAKYLDVESFNRVVGRADLPGYIEQELTAYSKVDSILKEYTMYALNDQMSPKEAMTEAAKLANEAIDAEK